MNRILPGSPRKDSAKEATVLESGTELSPLITGLLEHVPEMAVLIQGPQVEYVNRAFEVTTGFTLAEVKGLHPQALLGDSVSTHEAKALRVAVARGGTWSTNCSLMKKSGHDLPARVRLLVGGGPNTGTAVLLATSRSEQNTLGHDRRLQAVGQFTGRVAHSLNNHLTVIQAHVAAARDTNSLMGYPELEEVDRATSRAGALIQQLLLFSRRDNPRRVVTPVVPLLLQMIDEIRTIMPASVDVRAEISEDSGSVETEAGCIEQVILNLATNARDALPDGGTLTLTSAPLHLERARVFTTGVLDPGDYVKIRVRDFGTGMNSETMRQVFTPFFSTKPAGLGTGLGMPSVRELVRNNGGQIQLDSAPDSGTSVTVMLPRLPQRDEVIALPA